MISEKGKPAPLPTGKRWVVERVRTPGITPTRNYFLYVVHETSKTGLDFWIAFSEVVIILR
jgi:hypothetical protein